MLFPSQVLTRYSTPVIEMDGRVRVPPVLGVDPIEIVRPPIKILQEARCSMWPVLAGLDGPERIDAVDTILNHIKNAARRIFGIEAATARRSLHEPTMIYIRASYIDVTGRLVES